MRRKRTRIAGVMIAAIVASGMATGTSVYAGTTQSDMAVADSERLENLFSGVSLGNNDVAFGVLNTVAKRDPTIAVDSNGRYTYDVDAEFPLEYRIYFNEFRQGTSGAKHAFSNGNLLYKITPSGGGTTDVTKWPFPDITADRYELEALVEEIIVNKYYDNSGVYCNESGNATEILTDAEQGILTWKQGLDLTGTRKERPYQKYERDNNGKTYLTSNLEIYGIVGRPGDKIEVKVCQYWSPTNSGARLVLDLVPNYSVVANDLANEGDGVIVQSGYIYIPYEVSYDINGGTGNIPTVPTGECFTCDHNKVTTSDGTGLTRDGAELLGWSKTEVKGVLNAGDATPTDMVSPGDEYTIATGTEEDVTLYAVWGKTAPAGATLNLQLRGTDKKQTGKEKDSPSTAQPTFLGDADFELVEKNPQDPANPVKYTATTGTTGDEKGKTSFTGVVPGTYTLKETRYPIDNTDPQAPVKYSGYVSEWEVVVSDAGNGEFDVSVKDKYGNSTWQDNIEMNEWYFTDSAITKGQGNPASWWTADADTILIYNLEDTVVPTGLGGFIGGMTPWGWLIIAGAVGGFSTWLGIRHQRRKNRETQV